MRVLIAPNGFGGTLSPAEAAAMADAVPTDADGTVEVVDTLEKQGFTIDNPNAGGSCA